MIFGSKSTRKASNANGYGKKFRIGFAAFLAELSVISLTYKFRRMAARVEEMIFNFWKILVILRCFTLYVNQLLPSGHNLLLLMEPSSVTVIETKSSIIMPTSQHYASIISLRELLSGQIPGQYFDLVKFPAPG